MGIIVINAQLIENLGNDYAILQQIMGGGNTPLSFGEYMLVKYLNEGTDGKGYYQEYNRLFISKHLYKVVDYYDKLYSEIHPNGNNQ